MPLRQYQDGDIIFAEGAPCEAVYRVRSGEVEIDRPGSGGRSIGVILRTGDIFGEAGLLSGGSRRARARASGDTEIELIEQDEIVALIEGDNATSRPVARALSDQMFGGPDASLAFPPEQTVDEGDPDPASIEEAHGPGLVVNLEMVLIGDDERTVAAMGADSQIIHRLPFVAGRKTTERDRNLLGEIHLMLEDEKPYRLSRRHFAIENLDGRFVVRDFKSHHGTIVNGTPIGAEKETLIAPLQSGANEIVVGSISAPFRFKLTVETS